LEDGSSHATAAQSADGKTRHDKFGELTLETGLRGGLAVVGLLRKKQ